MTHEERVYAALSDEEGSDRFGLHMETGLSEVQVSSALQRLRRKGLAHCGRWHETSVWWRT